MLKIVLTIAAGLLAGMTSVPFTATKTEAQGYQIDCAILLCLAGGFPPSQECSAARRTMMRRITPWPIEPPLQIWRCPMGVSYQTPTPTERLWAITQTTLPAQSAKAADNIISDLAIKVAAGNKADIDISGSDFDFVRSIQVYHIDWRHHDVNSSGGGECAERSSLFKLGTYDSQGGFSWTYVSDIYAAPDWIGVNPRQSSNCNAAAHFRGVAIEWQDYEGKPSYEVVKY